VWILLAVMLLLGFFAWKGRQLKVDGAGGGGVSSGFGITWIIGYGALFVMVLFFLGAGVMARFPDVPAGEERVDPKERRDA
jgi:uncharacterized membrane protein